VKSQRVGLGIVLVLLAVSAVGSYVTDGLTGALSPALGVVVVGVVLYRLVKHPTPPRIWSNQRFIAYVALVGVTGLVTMAVFVWVLVVVPDWPTRLFASVSIAIIPVGAFWGVRMVRKEDQAARQALDGAPGQG
jgi:chromate transport protein ChrA